MMDYRIAVGTEVVNVPQARDIGEFYEANRLGEYGDWEESIPRISGDEIIRDEIIRDESK